MALWEYKIIGSGKGGFGSPSLLESHLNQLGKDEWEIIAFITSPENPLAFQGLARRTTQRDWTLQDAAAAAAKAEAEKLRAEFAAKFQAAQSGAPVEDKPSSLVADTAAPEDGLRRLRDTDRDQDPEALADSDEMDEVALDAEDELPTFFDYIRPYMRRNQRGPGLSLAVDYLANKIDQSPGDIVTALKECGFSIPEDEDDDPAYIEYDGDLYWVNVNRHHQLFINTKEKPRPVFRAVKGEPFAAPEKSEDAPREGRREGRHRKGDKAMADDSSVSASESSASEADPVAADVAVEERPASPAQRNDNDQRRERDRGQTKAAPAAANPTILPGGEELLAKLRPHMRRNRRGPGVSGSVGFLSRALDQSDAELAAALATVGFVIPERSNDKAAYIDAGSWTFWINKDNRGGLWINGREKRHRDSRAGGEVSQPHAAEPAASPASDTAAAAPETSTGAAEIPTTAESTQADEKPSDPPAEAPVRDESSRVADAGGKETPADSAGQAGVIALIRPLLKTKPRSSIATGEVSLLAEAISQAPDKLLQSLSSLGLAVPADGTEKSDAIEIEGESIWISRGKKDEVLSVNMKPAKAARSARAAGPGVRRPARKSARAGEKASE